MVERKAIIARVSIHYTLIVHNGIIVESTCCFWYKSRWKTIICDAVTFPLGGPVLVDVLESVVQLSFQTILLKGLFAFYIESRAKVAIASLRLVTVYAYQFEQSTCNYSPLRTDFCCLSSVTSKYNALGKSLHTCIIYRKLLIEIKRTKTNKEKEKKKKVNGNDDAHRTTNTTCYGWQQYFGMMWINVLFSLNRIAYRKQYLILCSPFQISFIVISSSLVWHLYLKKEPEAAHRLIKHIFTCSLKNYIYLSLCIIQNTNRLIRYQDGIILSKPTQVLLKRAKKAQVKFSAKIDIHASCFFTNFLYIHQTWSNVISRGPGNAKKSAGMRFGRAAALDMCVRRWVTGRRRSSDGLASSHEPVVFCEAVEPGWDGADGGGKEAVFQCARRDLLYAVGHRRVVVMVLMGAQLRAERVLVWKRATASSSPSSSSHSQPETDRAPELMRMVAHAGANGLEIGDLWPEAVLLLLSSPSIPLERVLLDVDDHATAVARQGSSLLGVPSLVLAVHGQET